MNKYLLSYIVSIKFKSNTDWSTPKTHPTEVLQNKYNILFQLWHFFL